MKQFVRRAVVALLLCCGTGMVHAQCVTLNAVDVPFTQDFDTLATTGTENVLAINGLHLVETGGGARDNELYAADTGSSNTGDTYSYGSSGSTDRALGALQSGSLVATVGACFVNNTGAAITALDIAYTGEQWRLGTADRSDRVDFEYSLDATDPVTGAWTGVAALAFSTPNTAAPTGAKDGNAAANRTALSANVGGLSIASGATFWMRWVDANASGADDGLAVDDFSLTARGQGGGGDPVLSISDANATEGAAGGNTEFLFTLSLNAPAGAGGVSVDYATADGTATAGSDYVGEADSVVIAEGATSATIGIVVIGDDDTEADETFFVDIVSATGAVVGDAQGQGTIVNDDITLTAIHDIQGSGQFSPFDGQTVSARGIVTGRKSNGFFLQAPDAQADADPATSEGIFVFTSGAPPAEAQVGNEVIVTGDVAEFIPAADPGQFPLTELVSPNVVFVSAGNALPTPVLLTTTFPDPAGPLDQLERVEGMRVTADSFTVVAATGGNVSETNATGSSNGQLNLVVTGTPRPFREPGIQAPDPAPGGGSIPPIPRWDFNPELLFSDTDALGGPRHDLHVGATLQDYVGPLDYGFRRYSVHQDPTVAPIIAQGPEPTAARLPTADEFTYATYNLERFFDASNDPAIGEPVLTADAYGMRLSKASLGIRNYLHAPDILGVVEVENLSTLQDLADAINADAVAQAQPDPQYVAYLLEGNDVGGIDVGFLVKTAEVAAGVPRVEVVGDVVQLGKDVTWNDPVNGPGTLLNDRPPLLVDAIVHYSDGRAFPLTLVQVHQRSLNGAESDDAGGARTRAKRQLQAEYLAGQVEGMQLADPQRRILVGGDFNGFEFNDGLADVMGTVTGMPSPDDETAVAGDGGDLVTDDLLNLYLEEPADQRYSFEFDGNAQSLDHVLVNQALGVAATAVGLDHARINVDFPEILRGDVGTVARLADHDPSVAYIDMAVADLSVTAGATPATVSVGGAMTFTATVVNDGPSEATAVAIGFAFDAELPDLAATQVPSGWDCSDASVGTGSTTIACWAVSLAAGADAQFTLGASSPAAESGNDIGMVAAVTAATFDPEPNNDSASASVAVAGDADMAVEVTGPASTNGSALVHYDIVVSNLGGTAAERPVLVVTLNHRALNDWLGTAPGWRCARSGFSDPTRFECRANADVEPGAQSTFRLSTQTRTYRGTSQIVVSTTVSTPSPDADASNDNDQAVTQIGGP